MKRFIKMKKLKRSTKQYIIVATLCFIIVGGAAIFAFCISNNNLRNSYEAKLSLANKELDDNRRFIYAATEDIKAGAVITKDNTEYISALSSEPQKSFINCTDIGKTALVDIPKNTQITRSIVTDTVVTNDLRETSYSVITNSSKISKDDTVDVRIVFPNGENYVVLPKKKIKSIKENETYLWNNEEDIQLMSSAEVDAYLYKGAKIYTTKYIKPSLQKESKVTYTPSLSTINLIKQDPNIIDIADQYLSSITRKELENRLAKNSKIDVTKTNWKNAQSESYNQNVNSNSTGNNTKQTDSNKSGETDNNSEINSNSDDESQLGQGELGSQSQGSVDNNYFLSEGKEGNTYYGE